MKKILIISLFLIFIFSPLMTVQASGGEFNFRSTVLGNGVLNTGSFVYRIQNQKNNFSSVEDIYILSRIFNIRNIQSFQIKQVIHSLNDDSYKTLYSPVYRPHGQWWSETYSWVNFGKLASGNYELKTYISVDGNYFRDLSRNNFRVYDYYDNYKANNHETNNYHYNYNWTFSDNNLHHDSGYIYSLENPKSTFKDNEDLVVLTKLSDINHIDRFQVKHELFKDGRNRYRIIKSPERHPNGDLWHYNYNYSNFGRVPAGNHTIKTFIKIEDGNWRQIDIVHIKVEASNYHYSNYYSGYYYDWTRTGSWINATR